MSHCIPPIARLPLAGPGRFISSVAVTAVLGAAILATPLTAHAQTPTPQAAASAAAPAATGAQTPPAGNSAEAKAETVEQRITNLHSALQITQQEEPKWDRVAQVMRDNAAAVEKLAAERDSQDATSLTAVQDLMEYQKFAQAHLAGLRKLTTSFDTLYKSMPASQQKVADQVFQTFGHNKTASAHS